MTNTSLKERGHTKLKFTVASFILHTAIAIGLIASWLVVKSTEPLVWGGWFASFNTTLAIYATTKTYKDRVIIESKENKNGDVNLH